MDPAVVLDIFDTSWGTMVIFAFPEHNNPRIGMRLKRLDGSFWKIAGITFERPSIDYYKDFEQGRLFSCHIEPEETDKKLTKGDTLFIE